MPMGRQMQPANRHALRDKRGKVKPRRTARAYNYVKALGLPIRGLANIPSLTVLVAFGKVLRLRALS